MKVGTKGKGPEIKWVEEETLYIYEEVKNLKQEVAFLKDELEKTKLENVEIVKGLISR